MTDRKIERFSVSCLQIIRFWRCKNFVRSVFLVHLVNKQPNQKSETVKCAIASLESSTEIQRPCQFNPDMLKTLMILLFIVTLSSVNAVEETSVGWISAAIPRAPVITLLLLAVKT